MIYDSIIPAWFVPSEECLDWLAQALHKAIDMAHDAYWCDGAFEMAVIYQNAWWEACKAIQADIDRKLAEKDRRRREKDKEMIRKYGYCPALLPDWTPQEAEEALASC